MSTSEVVMYGWFYISLVSCVKLVVFGKGKSKFILLSLST